MNEGPVRSHLPGQTSATPGGQPGFELETPKAGVSKVLPVVAVLGLGIACFGLVRSFVAPGPQRASAAPVPVASPLSEQTQMMREAMQMAREAREMQRERMEMMRKEMEFAEGGGEQPR